MLPIALLLAGSVGLVMESTRGIEAADQSELLLRVSMALEAFTNEPVVRETRTQLNCPAEGRPACLDDLRLRLGHRDLVVMILIGAPTRIRLVAERVAPSGVKASAEIDVGRAPETWNEPLSRWSRQLYPPEAPVVQRLSEPEPPRALEPTTFQPPAPAAPQPSFVLPAIVAGAGAVALGVAVGFELSSRGAHTRLDSEDLALDEESRLQERMGDHHHIATVSLLAGLGLFGASALLLLLE